MAGLLPTILMNFDNATDAEKKRILPALYKYTVMKVIKVKPNLAWENILDYLSAVDNSNVFGPGGIPRNANYIACPDSPFDVCTAQFSVALYKFLFKYQ